MALPGLAAFSDPKGHVLQTLNKLANAMLFLGESNMRLAEAIENQPAPR